MLRTKIVCTIGPATADPSMIDALVRTGMDVARINMSHGDRETHRQTLRAVRAAGASQGKKVGVLVDLQGPKIRVGKLAEPATLVPGQSLVFAPEGRERKGELPTTYAELAHDVDEGDQVLLDDGLLELVCTGTEGDRAHFEVIRGGILKSNKGINIPSGTISAASLSDSASSRPWMVPSSMMAKCSPRHRRGRISATARASASARGASRHTGQPVRARRSVRPFARTPGVMTAMPASPSTGSAVSIASEQRKPTTMATFAPASSRAAAPPPSPLHWSSATTSSAPACRAAMAAPSRICAPSRANGPSSGAERPIRGSCACAAVARASTAAASAVLMAGCIARLSDKVRGR